MNVALMRDIGAMLKAVFLDYFAFSTSTDAAEQTSAWIDRQGYESAKITIGFETTLTATETLTIAANIQESDNADGSSPADFGDAMTAAVVATGESGDSTENGVAVLDVDLSAAKRYICVQWTPTLSAGSSDTGAGMVTAVLGGAQEVPSGDRNN